MSPLALLIQSHLGGDPATVDVVVKCGEAVLVLLTTVGLTFLLGRID